MVESFLQNYIIADMCYETNPLMYVDISCRMIQLSPLACSYRPSHLSYFHLDEYTHNFNQTSLYDDEDMVCCNIIAYKMKYVMLILR